MCRRRATCFELGKPETWSINAPLPPPMWLRRDLTQLHESMRSAAAGRIDEALDQLRRIPDERIRDWCVEHGQMSGRFRAMNADPHAGSPADGPRNASASLRRLVLERDGYACRYCDLPVMTREVLTAFSDLVGPENFPLGRPNAARHRAALASVAQFDHVLPYQLGGPTTADNVVTACWACNYGKDGYTLAQLGIRDPREREPRRSNWDGLSSLFPTSPIRRSRPARATGALIGGRARFPNIHDAIRQELQHGSHQLRVSNSSAAAWVYFRPTGGSASRMVLRYRILDCVAELVMRKSAIDVGALHHCSATDPIPGARLAERGRTEVALVMTTPTLDATLASPSPESVRSVLDVIGSLRAWGDRHAAEIARRI